MSILSSLFTINHSLLWVNASFVRAFFKKVALRGLRHDYARAQLSISTNDNHYCGKRAEKPQEG